MHIHYCCPDKVQMQRHANMNVDMGVDMGMDMDLGTAGTSSSVITHIASRSQFHKLLAENPGQIIVKFGATWCKPCKILEPHVNAFFNQMPNDVICCALDVDQNGDVYNYLKSRRMLQGVPAVLCYNKGNVGFAPDDSIMGADVQQFNAFSAMCVQKAAKIRSVSK